MDFFSGLYLALALHCPSGADAAGFISDLDEDQTHTLLSPVQAAPALLFSGDWDT